AEVGEGRVAAIPQVLEGDRVLLADAPGEGHVGAHDVVVAAAVARGDAADEVLAPGDVDRGAVAEDEAQRGERLRREAVVVVVLGGGAVHGADRGIAGAGHYRALRRHGAREPELAGGTERE